MRKSMRTWLPIMLVLVPAWALAQPAPSPGSAAPIAGSAAPTAGSATPGAGSAQPAADPAPAPAPPAIAGDAAALRKACTDAMNADPTFAVKIVEIADKDAAERRLALDQAQHETAAAAVSKNQRHVILAYAAMWLVAAGFVLFLWRRQQALRGEIAQLKHDLDAASKDGT
jgi:hypothetical protein